MPIIFQGYIIWQIPSFMLPSKIIIMCQNTIKEDIIFFKQQLLKEFDADSIYAVAFRFAKQEITMLSWLFGLAFGKFNEEFIEIVAHAFEDKIETQISIEEYTS